MYSVFQEILTVRISLLTRPDAVHFFFFALYFVSASRCCASHLIRCVSDPTFPSIFLDTMAMFARSSLNACTRRQAASVRAWTRMCVVLFCGSVKTNSERKLIPTSDRIPSEMEGIHAIPSVSMEGSFLKARLTCRMIDSKIDEKTMRPRDNLLFRGAF